MTPAAQENAAPAPTTTLSRRIFAVANQKGGVGKTTTSINLGAALAQQGVPTLIIDTDPQGNTTSGLGIDKSVARDHNLYHAICGQQDINNLIVETGIPGLGLIPSNSDLIGAEVELVNQLAREKILGKLLDQLAGPFAYVLIDCPPSLGLLTVNALTAAGSVIIPLQCEYYALEGLAQLLRTIKLVREHLNPRLDIEGVLLTMYDARTNIADQVVQEVREHFKGYVFNTVIPRNVRLAEAPSHGKPVMAYDAASTGAKSYLALAAEVLSKNGVGSHTHEGRI
ncbi:MAG: ParA family protein [Nitrospirae bacterium]|nr:ParA family protein [Nitrospirota bacterium]